MVGGLRNFRYRKWLSVNTFIRRLEMSRKKRIKYLEAPWEKFIGKRYDFSREQFRKKWKADMHTRLVNLHLSRHDVIVLDPEETCVRRKKNWGITTNKLHQLWEEKKLLERIRREKWDKDKELRMENLRRNRNYEADKKQVAAQTNF
jgi:hypothetical protein